MRNELRILFVGCLGPTAHARRGAPMGSQEDHQYMWKRKRGWTCAIAFRVPADVDS